MKRFLRWLRQFGYRPTAHDIDVGARRYADVAGEVATVEFARAVRLSKASVGVEEFRAHYRLALIEAYSLGAREGLAMSVGDFTPEPWTD